MQTDCESDLQIPSSIDTLEDQHHLPYSLYPLETIIEWGKAKGQQLNEGKIFFFSFTSLSHRKQRQSSLDLQRLGQFIHYPNGTAESLGSAAAL
jgi:hypothetical protein